MNHNTLFSTSTILSSIITGLLFCQDSLMKIGSFTYDSLVQQRLCLHKNISDTMLAGRLKLLSMSLTNELKEIDANLFRKVGKKIKGREEIIDIDSTVKKLYGSQQGAEQGYNDKKKGANSYTL